MSLYKACLTCRAFDGSRRLATQDRSDFSALEGCATVSRLNVLLAHIEVSSDIKCTHTRSSLLPSMNLSVVPMKSSRGSTNLPSQARLFTATSPALLVSWRATCASLLLSVLFSLSD